MKSGMDSRFHGNDGRGALAGKLRKGPPQGQSLYPIELPQRSIEATSLSGLRVTGPKLPCG